MTSYHRKGTQNKDSLMPQAIKNKSFSVTNSALTCRNSNEYKFITACGKKGKLSLSTGSNTDKFAFYCMSAADMSSDRVMAACVFASYTETAAHFSDRKCLHTGLHLHLAAWPERCQPAGCRFDGQAGGSAPGRGISSRLGRRLGTEEDESIMK